MNKSIVAVIVVLGVAGAAGGGYWFGQQRPAAGGASGKAQSSGASGPVHRGQGSGRRSGGRWWKPSPRRRRRCRRRSRRWEACAPTNRSRCVRRSRAASTRSDSRKGNRWPKGVTLVKLDPAINEAEVLQAKANLTLASSKYDRAIDLQKQGFISGQAKDEAENNLKVAEAAVALAAARLAKTEIRAPFAGLIGLRSISVGDYVKEGQDMVNLEAIDPLKVDFRVPEIYLKQVQVGQKLEVTPRCPSRAEVRRNGLGDQSAGRRRRTRDRDPRAGEKRRYRAAARHVRARAPSHEGRPRRAGPSGAGAGAAGRGAVRVSHRRRQGCAYEGRDSASAATGASRSSRASRPARRSSPPAS